MKNLLINFMAIAILIGLWVWDELSFNKNHTNYDRIAQVMRSGSLNGNTFTFPYLPYALGDELKNAYGEDFIHIIVTSLAGEHILSKEDIHLAQNGFFIDSEGPEMLSLKMKSGTLQSLDELRSIILSSSAALALFGDKDPVGELIRIDNAIDVKVTGVYEDLPHNSRFHVFEEASETLAKLLGIKVSAKQVERVSERIGQILEDEQAVQAGDEEKSGTFEMPFKSNYTYVQMDGSMI